MWLCSLFCFTHYHIYILSLILKMTWGDIIILTLLFEAIFGLNDLVNVRRKDTKLIFVLP